jgi:hypothetical protein
LWRAESLIETGNLEGARIIINKVRMRIQTGSKIMTLDGSTMAANYSVGLYPVFTNYDQAIVALQTERRLEFAHEGHRFFDLVRWGIAETTMNSYLASEKDIRSYLNGVNFVGGKHEYFPIPQSQVDLGGKDENGTLLITQNPGY